MENMWNDVYPATEMIYSHEVVKQIAALTREVELLRIAMEQRAHHGWTYQPNSVWEISNEPDTHYPSQSYYPDWSDNPTSIWNQDFYEPREYTEYQHPHPFAPCKPSLEDTVQTFVQSTQSIINQQIDPMNAGWEGFPRHKDGEEWSWQPVDAQVVTTFEGGADVVDDNDEKDQTKLDKLDEVVHLVEPTMVEVADELCYPDLTDEQGKIEERSPVFGFPEINVDFFCFQNYYFIPSASFLKNCSLIDVADSVFKDRFLQIDDVENLLEGPADERDEDELIQVIEWLKLEKEFG